MKQPKQDIRAGDGICHEALSSEGNVDNGHEPRRVYEVVIGNNDINGSTNTLLACKQYGNLEVEPIVAALFAELGHSVAHAHMDGCIRTLPRTHKANIPSEESIGVEV